MKTKIWILALALLSATSAAGKHGLWRDRVLQNVTYRAILGYELGGTMPLHIPASIRGLNEFKFTPNFIAGVEMEKPVEGSPWVLKAALQFENKGMSLDSKVKNHHETVERGGEVLEGVFVGDVNVQVTQWMVTVPVLLAYHVSDRVFLETGPYISFLTSRDFHGWAHNGYLRVGDPTGPKVEMGETKTERGNYDFSADMRRVQMGIAMGASWHFSNRMGAFVHVALGFNGIFKSGFTAMGQTLHPVYGQFGLSYKLK